MFTNHSGCEEHASRLEVQWDLLNEYVEAHPSRARDEPHEADEAPHGLCRVTINAPGFLNRGQEGPEDRLGDEDVEVHYSLAARF